MEHTQTLRAQSHRRAPASHNTIREGSRLGLIVGVVTWLWLAGFDAVVGEPFRTFDFLGGVAVFTVVHFSLCLAYGLTIMSAVHASMTEPTVMFAIIFCTILFQAAFVMLTVLLANIGLGYLAWGEFLLGNLLAAGLTYVLIARGHPMRDMYDAAEALQQD